MWYTDVAIDVIASFKKIKALTLERALILKAIQNSSIVEVRKSSTVKLYVVQMVISSHTGVCHRGCFKGAF